MRDTLGCRRTVAEARVRGGFRIREHHIQIARDRGVDRRAEPGTAQLFLSHNRPGVVSTIQVTVLCASLTGLLLLVPRLGAEGAAIALLAAGALRWLMLTGGVRLVLKQPLPNLIVTRADLHYLLGRIR